MARKSPTTKPRADSAPGSAAPGAGADAAPAKGAYTVLARRYRSRGFDELVGQELVSRTLRNAIEQGRVAHAYLFTGTRGVGKTSTARILARVLNTDPALNPDLTERESIAAAILRGEDLDVIEIDAASNRGIDNIRDLIAASGIQPARCRYKIYIIDEVHQLTKEAFNALLKVMEEPPSHVKFILCTTEPNKVPATIQSRCQRFDFRAIPAPRIAAHLRAVLEGEGVRFDEDAIMQVARSANGSMRDALSLLDRLLSAAEGKLDAPLVESMLGLPDAAVVQSLVEAIADGEAGEALRIADDLVQRGNTVERAIDAIVEHLRALMIARVCGSESELLERAGDARASAVRQAERFDAPGLVHMIALCDAAARASRSASMPRALLDALVVRLAMAEHFGSLAAAIADGAAPAEEKKKPAALRAAEPRPDADAAGRAATPRSAPSDAAPTGSLPLAEGPGDEAAAVGAGSATTEAVEVVEAGSPPSSLAGLWAKVESAATRPIERALLEDYRPVGLEGSILRLRCEAERPPAKAPPLLVELVRRAAGRPLDLLLESDVATDAAQASDAAPGRLAEEALSREVVREAISIFEATLVEMVPPGRDARAAGERRGADAGRPAPAARRRDPALLGADAGTEADIHEGADVGKAPELEE